MKRVNRDIGCPVATRRIHAVFRLAAFVEHPHTTHANVRDKQIAVTIGGNAVRAGASLDLLRHLPGLEIDHRDEVNDER